MCCLFGILDYGGTLSLKSRQKILRVLSAECEERGTDATGIAYFTGSRLTIHKAPKPAHKLRFQLSTQARYIMGHTRMATQGSEKRNYNNHPFSGHAGRISFALAHNGVLWNDRELRTARHLPATKVETDSYVAVQLLEQAQKLDFSSLKQMAEAVRGSFTFTVLDSANNLYFVKGNNPMCICHFIEAGCYLYASTAEILNRVMQKLRLDKLPHEFVQLCQGDILRIAADGTISTSMFDNLFNDSRRWNTLHDDWGWPDLFARVPEEADKEQFQRDYMEDLVEFARFYGIERGTLELLLDAGYDWMDLEEMLYEPEFLRQSLYELQC